MRNTEQASRAWILRAAVSQHMDISSSILPGKYVNPIFKLSAMFFVVCVQVRFSAKFKEGRATLSIINKYTLPIDIIAVGGVSVSFGYRGSGLLVLILCWSCSRSLSLGGGA